MKRVNGTLYKIGSSANLLCKWILLNEENNEMKINLKKKKRFFKNFSIKFVLDESAGGSDDWAKGVAKIKYVYTVELRPSDDMNDIHSHFAFMLPSTFIQPVGQETFVGVKEFLRSLISFKKNQ